MNRRCDINTIIGAIQSLKCINRRTSTTAPHQAIRHTSSDFKALSILVYSSRTHGVSVSPFRREQISRRTVLFHRGRFPRNPLSYSNFLVWVGVMWAAEILSIVNTGTPPIFPCIMGAGRRRWEGGIHDETNHEHYLITFTSAFVQPFIAAFHRSMVAGVRR